MKQVIRWIGMGIVAAAALTMVFADMVLAQPAQAPAQTHVVDYQVRLDLFSPLDVRCRGTSREGHVRAGRDLMGRDLVTLHGPYAGMQILCERPGAGRFLIDARPDPRDPLAVQVDAILLFREGQQVPLMLVESPGQRGGPLPVRGNVQRLAAGN